MGYDEKYCDERHRGVAASLSRIWWVLATVAVVISGSVGYAVQQAAVAHETATVAHETARAAALHASAAEVKLDKIIALLEEKK